ncbi:uncharacterized protein LOC115708141 [Cannabis sativa]|uniref:uncharacterized protein LOC115708141 n=1 Tax=Cannabis sativa TaxID=3483 RepID=UPI0029CA61CF|nr:uncharacterized protein LOC115708141 [Cannabis sativa]XP_060959520.1 uncharacterized protein LOC115708141 [Cannabis sativa]
MGFGVFSPMIGQSLQCRVPLSRSSFSCSSSEVPAISFPNKLIGKSPALTHGLVLRSWDSFGLRHSRVCRASFGDFSDEEFSNQIEELPQKLSLPDEQEHDDVEKKDESTKVYLNLKYPDGENYKNNSFPIPFSSFKFDSSRPPLLGIEPEPPKWPERTEIVRASIERKANSIELPLSLRIIRKQRKWEEKYRKTEDSTYCSVSKVFSCMVFMVRELQTCALSLRENLYDEDLQEIITKMQRDMNVSFVWLFQNVFSRTPTLMVYLMILLPNFIVQSMYDNVYCGSIMSLPSYNGDKANSLGIGTKGSVQFPHFVNDNRNEVPFLGIEELNMDKEEINLWDSFLDEALKMQAESWGEALDQETLQQLVSPFNVQLEQDDYEHHFRTDLSYQIGLAREHNNPLLLSNYAQFLYLVYHDNNRAEECFRRAVEAEPPDAEALSRYADFLWIVRKDLWGAEERYQQAMAMESNNSYHASKYANFLWSTGGDETCFPLDSSHENCHKVL